MFPRQKSYPNDHGVSVSSSPQADATLPALRLWSIHRSITVAVIAALLLVSAMIAAAFWYAGWPTFQRDATVTAGMLFDLLKLVFVVVAGVGGVGALVVAYRRQRVAEHAIALAEGDHQLARAADLRAEIARALAQAADERAKVETDRNGVRLFNERFAKASEQLGSEKAPSRLAGAYAMASLADDWIDGRQVCIDVLCGYLRMPYTPPLSIGNAIPGERGRGPAEVTKSFNSAREEREVRHTVMRLIAKRLRADVKGVLSWRGLDFDFTGAVFDGGDFSKVAFDGGVVSFAKSEFCSGDFSFAEAAFLGGDVSFDGARFGGARVSFSKADFRGGRVSFCDASFDGGEVSFVKSRFTGGKVNFVDARFSGSEVSFEAANFNGGGGALGLSMNGAEFKDGFVSFDGVWLEHVDLFFNDIVLSGGRISFNRAQFVRCDLLLLGAIVDGGLLSFERAALRSAVVAFPGANFAGGEVSFQEISSDVSGAADEVRSMVTFDQATFDGGKVSFDGAVLDMPIDFDEWPDGQPPLGVHVSAGLRVSVPFSDL